MEENQLGYRGVSDVLANRSGLLKKIELLKFDGLHPNIWIHRAERFFLLGNYSDQEKLDLISVSFEGSILTWFNIELLKDHFHDWDNFERRLINWFTHRRYDDSGKRLFAISQRSTAPEENLAASNVADELTDSMDLPSDSNTEMNLTMTSMASGDSMSYYIPNSVGAKDVRDQIEDEDQLHGTYKKEEEEKEVKEEDKKVEESENEQLDFKLGDEGSEAEKADEKQRREETSPSSLPATTTMVDDVHLPQLDQETFQPEVEYEDEEDILATRSGMLKKIELPTFDGVHPNVWLHRAERFFRLGNYSDQDRLDLISVSFEGSVLNWFNIELQKDPFCDWDHFKRRLINLTNKKNRGK